MINSIKLLRNLGLFDAFTGTTATVFAKLTLIYGENGRGKTTLAAIFRSLINGDPIPAKERTSLIASGAPHVVIDCTDGGGVAVLQNDAWNRTYPNLRIFDDTFVDENIHSGLEVTSEHRQRLHQLIIGRQGVVLAKRVEDLTAQIAQLQTELRISAAAITADMRGPFSIDDYCTVTVPEDIDAAISDTQQRVKALQQAEAVRSIQAFEPFEPPTIDVAPIRTILQSTLATVDAAAAQAVQRHIQNLGAGGEQWVSRGMEYLTKIAPPQSCPFCNQSLDASTLIAHYRAYFREAYARHNAAIASQIADIQRILGEDAFVRFNRLASQQLEKHRFWSQIIPVAPFVLEMEHVSRAWQTLRKELGRLLEIKRQSPLEAVAFDDEVTRAVGEYEQRRDACRALSRSLLEANDAIRRLKEDTASGNLAAANNDLVRLRATKTRSSGTVAPLCTHYFNLKTRKEAGEAEKITAREVLDQHRDTVFPRYQTAINEYLRKFGAGFRIVEVQAVNPRGAPSSTYQLEINNRRVPLSQQNPGEQAFKNTLSAGDRNTLALAFFFASIDQEPALSSTVVVIDDPVSSLDDGRTITTAQEIRALTGRVAQVILLSHAKRVLCEVWEFAQNRLECTALSIIPDGSGSSIASWNVRNEAVTEYDRNTELLRAYADGSERDFRKVAISLRHVLEGYLRVACSQYFPPGTQIGALIGIARESATRGVQVLAPTVIQELEQLSQYAHRFHHETNRQWDVAVNNINEQELKSFVERTLAFTRRGITS